MPGRPPALRRLQKKIFSMALRFSSEGFTLAPGSRGTALTKSSPGCALACGTVENAFEPPIRRRPLRDCDHSWQRPSAGRAELYYAAPAGAESKSSQLFSSPWVSCRLIPDSEERGATN